jgi:glyoxylase-like metal-dependent hydrolase (beta-lactamase superfamily II)
MRATGNSARAESGPGKDAWEIFKLANKTHWLLLVLCPALVVAAGWIGGSRSEIDNARDLWVKVAPGILRTAIAPAGYALVDGTDALLIDVPQDGDGLETFGVRRIDGVLLTHYHRGSCAAVGKLLASGVLVRAPKGAEPWLTPDGVRKYWKESLPLRNSQTAYLVVPEGFKGIAYTLADGQSFTWRQWKIQVVSTPGHARSHVALAARPGNDGPVAVFCGGALARPGKLWAPYTTDWDHWTDAGLVPAARSLRRLAELKPDLLLPAHGPVVARDAAGALRQTAEAVEEVGFLKSFERYTKERLGGAPSYRFLAREQATSNGSKPWSQISQHLFLTGNTYVLTSRDHACLLVDPWDKRSADQFLKLQKDRGLGPLEVVMFSHAHFDHYDGVYHFPNRERFEVWTLDRVAPPIADPYRWRAPFLDPRPVKFDRTPRDGDTLSWREYRFRFQYFPGQSAYTMGVETVIDGKKCFFTADNFFHQDMFSGSGGWMGLNRSWPLPYAESARKVLDARPDWVLAEHGGPFEFNAEDFRRRVAWGQACARAADALCLSGDHRQDWNPHRIHVEPLVQKARAGGRVQATLVVDRPQTCRIILEGRGLFANQAWQVDRQSNTSEFRRDFALDLPANLSPGRHVFPISAWQEGNMLDAADAFMVVDVES